MFRCSMPSARMQVDVPNNRSLPCPGSVKITLCRVTAQPMALPYLEVFDGAASSVLRPDTSVRLVADGFSFTEGPAYDVRTGWWYFSDIPESRMWRWHQDHGLKLFRSPSHKANGNCLSREGCWVTCEHETRRLSMTDVRAFDESPDGEAQTAAYKVGVSHFDGKRLNSPNDVIERSDGTLWFTDPDYGAVAKMGHGDSIEQLHNNVFCFHPATNDMVSVSSNECRPNGLCFDPAEKYLYVADSGAWFERRWHDGKPHHVVRYSVEADGTLNDRHVIIQLEKDGGGIPDGLCCDVQGNIYVATLEGVHIYTPTGGLLAKIRTPETTANMCFGGPDNETLLMTSTSSIWILDMSVQGVPCALGSQRGDSAAEHPKTKNDKP